jgi:predicted acylesterase/phospholipase RssA
MTTTTPPPWFSWDCLAFSGANVKVYSHVGALCRLEEHMGGIPVQSWLRGTIGCSSGSVVALFLAAGARPAQILEWIMGVDYTGAKRQMKRGGLLRMFLRLRKKFGVMSSDYMRRIILDQLVAKTGLVDPSFIDLYEQTHIEFATVATSLRTGNTVYYSTTLTPHEKVVSACIASMSLPALLESVQTECGDILVDGGVTDYLPMNYFNGRCLGFMITAEKDSETTMPTNFMQHLERIIGIMCEVNNHRLAISQFGHSNVVIIPCPSLDIRSDIITPEMRLHMVAVGARAVDDFVAETIKNSF